MEYEPNPLPPSQSFSVECGDISYPIAYLDYAAKSLGQVTWPDGGGDFYRLMMDSIGVNPEIGGPSTPSWARGLEASRMGSGGRDPALRRERRRILFHRGVPRHALGQPPSSTGDYGQLFYRAVVAQQGFGAETNTYEYYPTAKKDSEHHPLISYTSDGDFNEYLIVMDTDIDAVSAMWSLTMYYAESSAEKTAAVLCPEQNNSCSSQYGICVTDIGTYHTSWDGKDGPIQFNDKYLILLSPEPPSGEADKVNWLPSPNQYDNEDSAVYFNITLRVYNAQITGSSNLSNGWTTPCILKWDRSNELPGDCSDGAVTGCFGDFNADGMVDSHDLAALFRDWGCTGTCIGDLDGDRVVDGRDVALFVNAWGPATAEFDGSRSSGNAAEGSRQLRSP